MYIVIVNAHWNNRGDEAAHRALWEKLQQYYPGCRITVMIKDRKPVSWFPDEGNMEYFSCQFKATTWDIWLTALTRGLVGKDPLLKKAVQTLRTADLIIYPPGGSVINDRFFWSKQMEYLIPFICARFYRIPMFVAAPSIGPFDPAKPRRIRKWLLQTPKVLCVREAISKTYLETIGIRDNVYVTMDLAFINSVDADVNQKRLETDYPEIHQFIKAHKKTVGITISDFSWHVKHRKNPEMICRLKNSFQQMIDYLIGQDYGILLIPQLFGNQNDTEYLKAFVKSERTMVISEEPDAYLQQYIISKLYAVVGMRYHCNIFAAKMGVPFVAVAYEEKMTGFLELAKLTDYGIPVEKVTFDKLQEKFQTLEKNHEQFCALLADGVKVWRQNARKTIDLLLKIY